MDKNRLGPQLADAMRDFLIQMDVPDEDILIERRSRSTYENATESAKVLDRLNINSVILVTEATHLERSLRCFRAQGIAVTTRVQRHELQPVLIGNQRHGREILSRRRDHIRA